MSATRRFAWLLGCLLALGVLASEPASAADCYQTAETCVEGPETRDIGGYPVQRDCWRYRASYTCVSQNSTDDCQPLRDRGCSQVNSRCMDTNPQGACMLYEQTWQCRVATGTTSTVTNCGGQQFCLDGRCFDTGYAPDAPFRQNLRVQVSYRYSFLAIPKFVPGISRIRDLRAVAVMRYE
jgi:conjugal transfer mating pair stabilization protein TraN